MTHGWAGRGSTRAWRATREAVLVRDGYVCRLKLEGCTHWATQAHNVAGKDAGDDLSNLIAACRNCNRLIGDPLTHNPHPRSVTSW
jgi:5-methylcytosine-specific restriction endonuclease McrA